MDIVERLRELYGTHPAVMEAVDYIEELEDRLTALEDTIEALGFSDAVERYELDKIKELKAMLRNAFARGKTNETR